MGTKTFTAMPDLSKVENALERAVLICLFTDKRVETEDLPYQMDTNGGWWGDGLPLPAEDILGDGYSWGSRLWLLERAKIDDATAQTVEEMIREALSPLQAGGIIDDVQVKVSRFDTEGLSFELTVFKHNGQSETFVFKSMEG